MKAMAEWKEEIMGDSPDLVETEWDAELDHRLQDVASGQVELVDHDASMKLARKRLYSRAGRRSVA